MAKPKTQPGEVIDVGGRTTPATEDEQQAVSYGRAVQDFLRSVGAFFLLATSIEKSALATLERARALELPTTAAEDEAIQRFARDVRSEARVAEDHWKITTVISQFHRQLTAKRARATSPLEHAGLIANGLHNRYVETEKRRVAVEQDRLRREAEERAKADRERELLKAEHEALEREASAPTLSDREQAFVNYVADRLFDAPRAAGNAGYKSPRVAAERLLGLPKIQKAIEAKRDAAAIRKQAQAVREQPLEVETPAVRANIIGGAGRTSHSAELLDEAALIAAVLGGKHGIPTDILQINTAKLNEYARSIQKRIELWPGVRYNKKTSVI